MPFLTPSASGEQQVLATFALQQLAQVRTTAYGLSDEQVRATPTVSAFSIGALLRHTGRVAQSWAETILAAPERVEGDDAIPDDTVGEHETAQQVLAEFDDAVAAFRRALEQPIDLSVQVPVPEAPWFEGVDPWERRWALTHLVAEIARHAGHADIIRETIDGHRSMG